MCHRLNTGRVPGAVRTIGLVVAWLFWPAPLTAEPPPTAKPLLAFKGHTGDVVCATFSPDGKTVASVGSDHTIRLWEAAGGKELVVLKTGELFIHVISFSPDGKTLATGGGSGLHLWDLATRKRITADQGLSPERVSNVAFSPDGKTVVYSGVCDNRLELWDAATGKRKVAFEKPEQRVSGPIAPAFTADGRTLVSCRWDEGADLVDLWDVATKKCKAGAKMEPGESPEALTQDGRLLATCEPADKKGIKVRLRDVTGKELAKFDERFHLERFAFSKDGKTLVAGDGWVVVWDVATGKERMRFQPSKYAQRLALSPDGTALATSDVSFATDGEPRVIKLWEVPRLK